MTLNQFIERLESLREITGGDVHVVVPVKVSFGKEVFEVAMAEVQNVIPQKKGEKLWISDMNDDFANTENVISVV